MFEGFLWFTANQSQPSSPPPEDDHTFEPPSSKKPRRSGRLQAKGEKAERPKTPPTPLIKDGLPTPNPDTFSTKTTKASPVENASSAPSSPCNNLEATQVNFEATQIASQFIQPASEGSDVWGYLIPIDMDKSLGDFLVLKKRSLCTDEGPSDNHRRTSRSKPNKG